MADNRRALDRIVAASGRCAAVVGFVDGEGDDLYNAAAVCADGRLHGVYHKQLLPNYEVFDERRYFEPGTGPPVLYRSAGVRVAVTICEDAWAADGPLAEAGRAGAELIVNINGSPFHAGKVGRARADPGRPGGRGGLSHRLREPGRRAGRAGLRRRLAGASTPTGEVVTRAPQFERACCSSPISSRPRTPPGSDRGPASRSSGHRGERGGAAAAGGGGARRARACPPSARCTRRSCWAPATT